MLFKPEFDENGKKDFVRDERHKFRNAYGYLC